MSELFKVLLILMGFSYVTFTLLKTFGLEIFGYGLIKNNVSGEKNELDRRR